MKQTELIEGELYQWVDSPITFLEKVSQAGIIDSNDVDNRDNKDTRCTCVPFMFLHTRENQCWFAYVNKFGDMKKGFLFGLEIKGYVIPAASENE